MDNITKEAYETIRKLILESEWGRAVTNTELYSFLFSEVYEFLEGCNNRDRENMLEEASDVLMILLYIVIKNTDNQQDNQIEELLYRVNKKLHTRYSIFFEGNQNSEDEEIHWMQTKRLEKEILHYLFCPNPDCHDYAKANKGNMMIINGNRVQCLTCGYTAQCGNNNMILYASKYRRKLMNTLDNSYIGYLNGTPFFADDYFNSHHKDYIKVVRYWATNKSGSLALKDYFTSKHASPQLTFDEFLMYPLRNFVKSVLNHQAKPSRLTIEINDLMIKCINANYAEIKERFCERKNSEHYDIWINYIRYLLKTMILPVTYEPVIWDYQTFPKDIAMPQAKNQLLPLNSYVLHMSIAQNQKIDMYLGLFSTNDSGNGAVLQADIASYKLNTQVGQVLMSAVLKFNLQHIQKLRCVLLNGKNNLNQQELSEFLKDILPMSEIFEFQ